MRKKLLFALLSLLLLPLGVIAQNVDISPNSGNLVAAVGDAGETGFALGLSALWRHEQLALSMTATDRDGLLTNGEVSHPSAVLGVHNGKLIIVGGRRPSYLVVSLPKGYRITGYRLVLANDLVGANLTGNFSNVNSNQEALSSNGYGTMRFYETKPWATNTTNSRIATNQEDGFTDNEHPGYNSTFVRYINPGVFTNGGGYIGTPQSDIIRQAKADDGDTDINTTTGTNGDSGKKYIIERHSMTDSDMGNQLYFRLVKDYCFYALTIESFEIDFTAEGTFDAPVVPAVSDEAQMVVKSPFPTSKTDIGAMERRTQTGTNYTYFAYDYENVTDLTAYNYLYQQGAVVKNGEGAGEPHEVAGVEKHIHPVYVDGKNHYAFNNDLYYVEPPISVGTSSGLDAPIGFRIVGAKFKYLWGTESNGGTIEVPNAVQIFYNYSYTTYTYPQGGGPNSNNPNSTTNNTGRVYLNDQLHFTTSQTNSIWQIDDDGYIYNSEGYLSCRGDDDLFRTISISTAEPGTDAAKWHLRIDSSNGNLYYQDSEETKYYLQVTIDDQQTDNRGRVTRTAGRVNTNSTPYLYKDVTENAGIINDDYWPKSDISYKEITLSEFHPGKYTLKVYGTEGAVASYYTEDEANAANALHLVADANEVEPGEEGYVTTYEEGYTEIKEGDIKSKKDPVFTKEVASADDADTYELEHLNNDAVAFEISGLESGKQALVEVTLQLQALDPYINSMNIVCTDIPKELQMIQTFTANNFRVSGGEFVFYVPSKYRGQKMNLEFSNLRSDYADETYPTGSDMHNSRYSFVTSEYFEPIDGKDDDGLYDAAYSPDASYENKIIATTAGNIRYKFNNAENIGTGSTGSAFLTEYPFSVEAYLGSADPDPTPAGQTPKTGTFIPCQVTAGDGAQEFGTFYLFTADEPRYNIAPTKAWQHRSYAFYRMDVKVVAKDYDPVFTWTPIYNTALYGDDKKTESQWGLTVTTKEKGTDTVVQGYLTYEDIIDHLDGCEAEEYTDAEAVAWNERLEGAIASGTVLTAEQASAVNAAVAGASYAEGGTITPTHSAAYNATLTGHISGGDEKKAAVTSLLGNNTTAPKTTEQILYVDGSDLLYILEDDEINETTLKNKLGSNALIFLPLNVTSEVDNVAFMTGKVDDVKSFKAGKNIVLTDKQPFFTPYNIQVGSANYATYSREITVPKNGKVTNASVMLPFTLALDASGIHTNPTGSNIPGSGLKFSVNNLGAETNITKTGEIGPYNHGIAYFKPITPGIESDENVSAANKSYMIKVEGDAPADKKISFIATQTGSLIVKTLHQEGDDGYVHTGELLPGDDCDKVMKFGDQTLAFTNYGTYSGAQFSRDNNNIFYFANNQYVTLQELAAGLKLSMFPFRGVFAYEETGTSPSRNYSLTHFDVSYDEPSLGDATGIEDRSIKADLMIRTDKGSMTISSTKEQVVTVYSANGICVAKANMQGGDTQTINLPSGVYVVNNVKIAVK